MQMRKLHVDIDLLMSCPWEWDSAFRKPLLRKCKNPGGGQEHDGPCQRRILKSKYDSFLRSKFTVTKDIFKAKI